MGKVALSDPDASTLNLSYWLHPEGRSRGWMTTAVKTVTTWASTSLDPGLSAIRANVARDNRASSSVWSAQGFVVAETHAEYPSKLGRHLRYRSEDVRAWVEANRGQVA